MDQTKYGLTKQEAVRAYQDGRPSALPDSNRWKYLVEDHRWGKHYESCPKECPVAR